VIRGDSLRDRAREVVVVAIVVYLIAFYAFDLPDWLKLAAGIVLGGAWLALFIGLRILNSVKRGRVK